MPLATVLSLCTRIQFQKYGSIGLHPLPLLVAAIGSTSSSPSTCTAACARGGVGITLSGTRGKVLEAALGVVLHGLAPRPPAHGAHLTVLVSELQGNVAM